MCSCFRTSSTAAVGHMHLFGHRKRIKACLASCCCRCNSRMSWGLISSAPDTLDSWSEEAKADPVEPGFACLKGEMNCMGGTQNKFFQQI